MIPKPIDSVVAADIQGLVEAQVPERRTLDYKRDLPGATDEDKREFLADVCSFANAAGGDLIYGVEEDSGKPVSAPGVVCDDTEAAVLRLSTIVRDCLQPRLVGVRVVAVPGFDKGPVVVVRVPRSWMGPHMVAFRNSSRFYTRDGAGKHQMDVTELRSAFALTESLAERIRQFRAERLGRIAAQETPVPLGPGAKLVLHLLPPVGGPACTYLDMAALGSKDDDLKPLGASGWSCRFNLDGFVTFVRENGEVQRAYCQVFRTGQVEAVCTGLAREKEGVRFIGSVYYERLLLDGTTRYLEAMRSLGIPCPIVVAVTLTGVAGARLAVGTSLFAAGGAPIDRDTLVLPDVVVDDYPAQPAAVPVVLRPVFDAVWNACGYERCFNFDGQGAWAPRS